MISFFKSLLLIGLLYVNTKTNEGNQVKIACNELGLYFILPAGFISLDSLQMDALSKRGEKAVDETFNKESLQGWQPVCVNRQDSFKRSVLMTVIGVKEAVDLNGSVDKFIDNVFRDGNDFIVQRFKIKANIDINETETAQQTEITIAGMKVRKNAFTFTKGNQLMFFSRYYFFQKKGKLFLLAFLGSPKANDNEEVVTAIENAKSM